MIAQTLEESLGADDTRSAGDGEVAGQFAQLLTAHWNSAYRYAFHLTGHKSDAEDLVQQAAEEAYRAFKRFRTGTRFDRWLMTIIHNSFIDETRRRRRRPVVPMDEVSPEALTADDRSDPEAAA